MENLILKYISVDLSGFPFPIQILLLLTFFFFSVAFIIFSFIFISRLVDSFNMKRRKVLEAKAQRIIISYLFDEKKWSYNNLKTIRRKYLHNEFQREVFLSCLTQLQINIIGKSAERLKSLYIGLRLHRRSLKKLNSASWSVAAKGIIELAEMDMKEYIPEIRAFINHKNPILRSEAQAALIQLEYAKPFDFLDDLNEPLMDWQQIQLAHVSEELDPSTFPDFKRWLYAKDKNLVIFSLRMISLLSQRDAARQVMEMLFDPNTDPQVKCAVIFTVRQLDLHEAQPYLKLMFAHSNIYIQQEIIKTLATLNCVSPEAMHESIINEERKFLEQFYQDSSVFIPEGDQQKTRIN